MSEQVLAAINALYHNENSDVKSQANKWLEHWQQSEAAWMQADALLHNPATPMDSLWFCAQTLRTKVIRPGRAVQPLHRTHHRPCRCNATFTSYPAALWGVSGTAS
jgi:hypothetical protein